LHSATGDEALPRRRVSRQEPDMPAGCPVNIDIKPFIAAIIEGDLVGAVS
jgi:hypothetical protein